MITLVHGISHRGCVPAETVMLLECCQSRLGTNLVDRSITLFGVLATVQDSCSVTYMWVSCNIDM